MEAPSPKEEGSEDDAEEPGGLAIFPPAPPRVPPPSQPPSRAMRQVDELRRRVMKESENTPEVEERKAGPARSPVIGGRGLRKAVGREQGPARHSVIEVRGPRRAVGQGSARASVIEVRGLQRAVDHGEWIASSAHRPSRGYALQPGDPPELYQGQGQAAVSDALQRSQPHGEVARRG